MPQVNLNTRLRARHARLSSVSLVDISQLDGVPPDTLALEALDPEGRLIYVHVTPSQVNFLERRLHETQRYPWFQQFTKRFYQRTRGNDNPYQHRGDGA